MFNEKNIEILSAHITVVHHVKGRIRYKIDPKIQSFKNEINIEAFEGLDKKIDGIRQVSINKLAKSLTIEYSHTVFEQSFWEELAVSKEYAQIAEKLNNLIKGN